MSIYARAMNHLERLRIQKDLLYVAERLARASMIYGCLTIRPIGCEPYDPTEKEQSVYGKALAASRWQSLFYPRRARSA